MMVNIESRRQEDFEDLKVEMEEMGTEIVESLQESQRQGYEVMLTFLKELKESCSDDNKAIVDRLTVLESKALAKQKILVRDIGGFEEAMMQHSDAVVSAMKTELEAFGSSLAETNQLILQ